jgi:hypothetical protein
MRISVNNVNFVDKWGIRKHNKRPRTPFDTRIAVGLNGSSQPDTDFSEDGVYDCSPMVTLSGAKKNEVTIVLPKAITPVTGQPIVANDGTIYRVSVEQIAINLFGYLGQNGAKFQ